MSPRGDRIGLSKLSGPVMGWSDLVVEARGSIKIMVRCHAKGQSQSQSQKPCHGLEPVSKSEAMPRVNPESVTRAGLDSIGLNSRSRMAAPLSQFKYSHLMPKALSLSVVLWETQFESVYARLPRGWYLSRSVYNLSYSP